MGRFIFDIFIENEPVVSLPIHLVFRKRGCRKIKAEIGEAYITTIEADSYDEAAHLLTNNMRLSRLSPSKSKKDGEG